MKKGLLLSVLALSMSLAVMGQAQLDLQSRAALRAMRSELAADSGSLPQPMRVRAAHVPGGVAMVQPGDCQMVGAMVRVKEGTSSSKVKNLLPKNSSKSPLRTLSTSTSLGWKLMSSFST